ncbi:MAG: hypothetical protein EOS50_30250 [Mesorhizobium sp.]|nr:MAG: hypothetical protein EOS50_30250 [Mesorhizobium sp.]
MGRKRGSRNAKAPIADKTEAPAEPLGTIAAPVDAGGTAQPAVAGADAVASAAPAAAANPVQEGNDAGGDAAAVLKGDIDGEATQQADESAEDTAAPGSGVSDGEAAGGSGGDQTAADQQGDDASVAAVETAANFLSDIAASGEAEDDLDAFTVAELARAIAGGARVFASGGLAVDYEEVFSRDEAAIMADFVRDNPDAPVTAMFIHLGLKKRYPRTEPNTADLFVLSLFHSACLAAFKFEAERAAEEAAAQAKPAPSGGWPGERALIPEKPAMSPTGFSPR